ncbi:metal-dependent transcriptional regulator [bacterium]|nr:metal-dependent transcriptional regulator [candidate division CSSED10-310 bacterium]
MMKIGALSESLEDYLEIIYQLIQETKEARIKDIADRKNVSMSSVIPALRRLSKENLVNYKTRGIVTLTSQGQNLAARLLGRHEFVKYFLMSLLDVPEEIAERDACLFEHYMSPETFRKMVMFFEFVDTCGMNIRSHFEDYIANLDKQGDGEICPAPECPFKNDSFRRRQRWGMVKTLSSLSPGESGRVARVQADTAIRQRLIDMGVLPNVVITVERMAPLGDPIEIKLRGYHLSLRKEEADAIILYPST